MTGFIKSLHLGPVSVFVPNKGHKRWHRLEMLDQGFTIEFRGEGVLSWF